MQDGSRSTQSVLDELVAAGDKNLQLASNANDELYNRNGSTIEPPVDGSNPSDLGHEEMATFWTHNIFQSVAVKDRRVVCVVAIGWLDVFSCENIHRLNY